MSKQLKTLRLYPKNKDRFIDFEVEDEDNICFRFEERGCGEYEENETIHITGEDLFHFFENKDAFIESKAKNYNQEEIMNLVRKLDVQKKITKDAIQEKNKLMGEVATLKKAIKLVKE